MMLYDDYRTTWYRLSESHVVKREREAETRGAPNPEFSNPAGSEIRI